jgi:hypothetical protein
VHNVYLPGQRLKLQLYQTLPLVASPVPAGKGLPLLQQFHLTSSYGANIVILGLSFYALEGIIQ